MPHGRAVVDHAVERRIQHLAQHVVEEVLGVLRGADGGVLIRAGRDLDAAAGGGEPALVAAAVYFEVGGAVLHLHGDAGDVDGLLAVDELVAASVGSAPLAVALLLIEGRRDCGDFFGVERLWDGTASLGLSL